MVKLQEVEHKGQTKNTTDEDSCYEIERYSAKHQNLVAWWHG